MDKKIDLTKDGIVFDAKPDAIPFNYRISYKISLLCMIIKVCCGRRGCSLIKMHIIATAVSDLEYKRKLEKYLKTNIDNNFVVRFEPAVNRALEYALADEFMIQQANGAYKLTDKGKGLTSKILEDKTIFLHEKSVLEEIHNDLTEEKIRALLERWKYQDVKN